MWGYRFAGALISALITSVQAQACGPFKVAFYEMGALYYKNAQGQRAGIDLDVIDELARRSGCRLDSILESRVRIWDRMSRGLLDISVSGIPTPERQQFAEFVPYFSTRNLVLLHRDDAAALATPEAFLADRTRRVAVVKSFKHGKVYDAWLAGLRMQGRVDEVPDFEGALRLFRLRRVDAILALPLNRPLVLKWNDPSEDAVALDWAPQERLPHGLILSRSRISEPDRERLRIALQSMLRDGSVDAILKRHVGEALASSLRLEAEANPR